MALTYGFYNSINGDRKYNAEQFGAIFDGIIRDGVYSTIGNRLVVQASGNGFQVNVQTGRAWFNHSWTYNDTIYPVQLPNPEPLLDKYVAVVLEVNSEQGVRRNGIVTVSGTPSTNPTYPTLINTGSVHQYPLAYCLVKAGAITITQAEITNMVGTSACPYVTGVLTSFSIDELIAQWRSQWQQFMAADETQFNAFVSEYQTWIAASRADFTSFMSTSSAQFAQLISDKSSEFAAFMSRVEEDATEFMEDEEDAWDNWFDHMKGQLTEDAATHLQEQIDDTRGVVLTGTLLAGETSVSFSDLSITDDAIIETYTTVFGVSPTNMTQSGSTLTVYFNERESDVGVKVLIRKE